MDFLIRKQNQCGSHGLLKYEFLVYSCVVEPQLSLYGRSLVGTLILVSIVEVQFKKQSPDCGSFGKEAGAKKTSTEIAAGDSSVNDGTSDNGIMQFWYLEGENNRMLGAINGHDIKHVHFEH